MHKTSLENLQYTFQANVERGELIFNRRQGPSSCSPFYLLFDTQPPQQQKIYPEYKRDATIQEENDWAKKLINSHAAPITRSIVASSKHSRNMVRAY